MAKRARISASFGIHYQIWKRKRNWTNNLIFSAMDPVKCVCVYSLSTDRPTRTITANSHQQQKAKAVVVWWRLGDKQEKVGSGIEEEAGGRKQRRLQLCVCVLVRKRFCSSATCCWWLEEELSVAYCWKLYIRIRRGRDEMRDCGCESPSSSSFQPAPNSDSHKNGKCCCRRFYDVKHWKGIPTEDKEPKIYTTKSPSVHFHS